MLIFIILHLVGTFNSGIEEGERLHVLGEMPQQHFVDCVNLGRAPVSGMLEYDDPASRQAVREG
ncbi:MAG: hypothetical protein KZQ87_19090, partial [Candidatus Thiodiazotropha sp. (ex Cardiolucina cf. quadrata)]|nr:hypothetical protein [Candidatus Thiodiazotropha sp. (ex Cardiolucina cf. quadrata)]